ncbi:MAG: trypsin-like peptidase domain-containing protein [Planctomycetes bacterium]|nr:trypsin-like peptidase domain-containing protein [Planctomycetota bacterium]
MVHRFRLAATLLALISAPALADQAERAFNRALAYTVEIRTMVKMPFLEEAKGAYTGAGFVVDRERGWILTNAHVAARSPAQVSVAFRNTGWVSAEKLFVDRHLDVAILAVPKEAVGNAISAELACEPAPGVGHPVGAFGHPNGLKFTGTRGIISGTTDRFGAESLQTDAAINPGNSGGPLISLDSGKVIGISVSSLRGAQNTNFSVPINYVCRILELLKAGKDPAVPKLGLAFFEPQGNGSKLKVARNYGDPARLPLEAGDTVVGVAGTNELLQNETQLLHALRGQLDSFVLRVLRRSHVVEVPGSLSPYYVTADQNGLLLNGVIFSSTHLRDAAEGHIGGVMVHDVESGSDGEQAGLQAGDYLVSANGHAVDNLAALQRLLEIDDGKITMVLKRRAFGDRLFTYVERELGSGKSASLIRYSPADLTHESLKTGPRPTNAGYRDQ